MKRMHQTTLNGLGSVIALLAIAGSTAVLADTVEMRDGKLIQGTFVGGTQTTVRLQTTTELKVIPVADILAVTFDRPVAAAATTPAAPAVLTATVPVTVAAPAAAAAATVATAAQPVAASAQTAVTTVTTAVTPAPAAVPPKPSLAAGSKIQVRITETVDSTTQKAGQKFTGVLTVDLKAGETILVPAGAAVAGELAAGTAPQPALQLVLTGITINDQLKPLATDDVVAISAPVTKKNLKSSALGAALGALAGGSDGALKAAGAAALADVIAKGDSVKVPASSVLEFQLKTAFTP